MLSSILLDAQNLGNLGLGGGVAALGVCVGVVGPHPRSLSPEAERGERRGRCKISRRAVGRG